ncbi:MAG: ABC transporter permease [Peptostreptococcaceae bacterium]|nr:ABC transporter permease [Peptostreptococcaceae bacterium]
MNRIIFYIKETLKSLYRNKNTSVATVLSMALTFLILGITLVIVLNVNNFVITTKQEFSGLQIFLKNEVDEENITSFMKKLENNEYLKDISFVSKKETMANFITNMGSDSSLFSDIENPCENSFVVYITKPQMSKEIVTNLKEDDRVSSISYYQDTIDTLIRVSRAISFVSFIIIIVLFILSLVIIENMIKIAIFARMREITIMKNIGATNWFVRWPFLLEGAILGMIGSFLSYIILVGIYSKVYDSLTLTAIFAKYMVDITIMKHLLMSLFIPTGIGIGMIGSIISLRKYLKV